MASQLRTRVALVASLAVPLAAVVALVVFVREPAGWQSLFGGHDHGHSAGGSDLPVGPHGGVVAEAGRSRLELLVDDRNGTAQLFVSSKADGRPRPVAALAADLRLMPAPGVVGEPVELKLLALPTADDPADAVSRFIASGAPLAGLEAAHATVTIVTMTATLRGEFALGHETHPPAFVCPMRCDNGRAHSEPGNCPRCGMALRASEDAHVDHAARHGGTLFMATDGFHHVEGVLSTPREFRLYVYNDFTQPVSVARFRGEADVELISPDGVSLGSVTAPLLHAEGGQYLRLPVAERMNRSLEIRLSLSFPGRGEADRFDFVFSGTE